MTKEKENDKKESAVLAPKDITDKVLLKVNTLKKYGSLKLPSDYSPENALKGALLILHEAVDKDKKPVLNTCTEASISMSLLNMVIKGLNPIKSQCYFIAYGNKLVMMPSYFGNIATAKRVGMKTIVPNVIYDGDEFIYKIDEKSGRKGLIKHEQKMENIDITKIKGAYAIVTFEDGSTDMEIMTISQIKKAWNQGAAKGGSGAHTNFTDTMAKKTVVNRACKTIINSSDDSYLAENNDNDTINSDQELQENANQQIFEITPATELVEEQNHQDQSANEKSPIQEPGTIDFEGTKGKKNGPNF